MLQRRAVYLLELHRLIVMLVWLHFEAVYVVRLRLERRVEHGLTGLEIQRVDCRIVDVIVTEQKVSRLGCQKSLQTAITTE